MASQLPGARAAIADKQGLPTPEFYRFLLGLQRLSAGSATSADIAALQTQIAAIQAEIDGLPQSGGYPTLQVTAPLTSSGLLQNGFALLGVNTLNSVVVNGNALQLAGDASTPGNTYFYGTGPTGAKGWQALSGVLHGSTNVAVTFAADGTATFDLQPLTDSGSGTFKLLTRDAYGRLSGTKDGTTDDVPEGSTNLYHTAARVRAVLLTGLSTATNAVIAATDTVLGAFGKLQAQLSALTSRTISTTAPLSGGGDLSANRTLSISAATTSAAGSMSATDKAKLDGIASGATAYTDSDARSAVVASSITDGDTTHAPSGDAVFDALAQKFDKAGGTISGNVTIIGSFNSSNTNFSIQAGGNSISLAPNGVADTSCIVSVSKGANAIQPASDNVLNCGRASNRWKEVFAGTGVINTSDAREKTEPRDLTDAELACAADLSRAIGTYQWLASIADKGADKARHHAGLTVQRAIEIMQAHGLDPFRYAFICYDEWPETPEQRDPETGDITQPRHPAGDRYSFRTGELLMFIARGLAARLDALESI